MVYLLKFDSKHGTLTEVSVDQIRGIIFNFSLHEIVGGTLLELPCKGVPYCAPTTHFSMITDEYYN